MAFQTQDLKSPHTHTGALQIMGSFSNWPRDISTHFSKDWYWYKCLQGWQKYTLGQIETSFEVPWTIPGQTRGIPLELKTWSFYVGKWTVSPLCRVNLKHQLHQTQQNELFLISFWISYEIGSLLTLEMCKVWRYENTKNSAFISQNLLLKFKIVLQV